jgi:hypothetical protein
MTDQLPAELIHSIKALEAEIRQTPPDARLDLQRDLHRLCERLEHAGYIVPERLRALDQILTDAVTEAQFDNLPV